MLISWGVIVSDISITYDLLFDILKMEKSRDELQKLDHKFYTDIVHYLNGKDAVIDNPNTPMRERELTKIQLGNVKKLLIELYDRREKKLINLAIYKVKTGDGIINIDALLEEEKPLFEMLYSQLFRYRSMVLHNILEGKISMIESAEPIASGNSSINAAPEIEDESTGIKSVRFTKPVPRFLGPELEVYGPFEENDIASLPSKIANILLRKERAEEMQIN
jgi:DNA replication initiation complex subunit (GINS family)